MEKSLPKNIQRNSSNQAECRTRAKRLRFRNMASAWLQGVKGMIKVKSVLDLSLGCLLITNNKTKTATLMPKLSITALIIVELLTLSKMTNWRRKESKSTAVAILTTFAVAWEGPLINLWEKEHSRIAVGIDDSSLYSSTMASMSVSEESESSPEVSVP